MRYSLIKVSHCRPNFCTSRTSKGKCNSSAAVAVWALPLADGADMHIYVISFHNLQALVVGLAFISAFI